MTLRGYDTSQIEKVLVALKDSATYSRQASYGLGEAVATASEGLKNENSIVVDNAGVTKNVAKMWEDYAKSIGKTTNNLTQAEKIQAEVNGILEETKFQTGDAEKYVNSYSGMIARLNASFTTLKQTLGTAFMQIFQAILPLIQSVINALIQLASVFASLVNSVFGKFAPANKDTAKSSKAATSAIEKQGDAAEKAGKQAEGALLSFDKLNVLDENKGSGSSGGAGIDVPEISAEGAGTSLAEELTNAFEGMSAYDIGFSISKKINEALSNINWGEIQAQAQNIAYNLAMFLNGAVAGLDWALLGNNIAEAINTALIFVYTWLTTFDFTMFGTGLANGLNGIVDAIDWILLGQTLAKNLQSTFDVLYGFVTTFDWASLGLSVASSIQAFFESIDWEKSGTALSEGFIGILETLDTVLDEVDWNKIGTDIASFLEAIDWVTILANVGKLIEDAIGASLDIAGGILGIDPLVLETLAVGFLSLAGSLKVVNLITAVTTTVTTAMSASLFPVIAVVGLVTAAIATVVWIITEVIEQLKIIGENWPVVWEAIKNKFNEVKENIVNSVQAWVEKFKEKFEELKTKVTETVENIKATISQWIQNIKSKFEEMKNNIHTICTNIKTTAVNIFDNIKSKITEIISNLKNSISNSLNNIKTVWSNIFNSIKTTTTNIFNSIWTVIKNIINSILGGIEGMANGVTNGINAVIGAINGLSFDIPDWVPVFGGKKFNFNIPNLNQISLPRLATGAVIPPRQEFMAVLGDQKNGRNLEAPEGLIRQIVREESGNKKVTIITKLIVDKRELAEIVKDVDLDEETTSPDLDGGGSFVY